jgi:hypothetical protein
VATPSPKDEIAHCAARQIPRLQTRGTNYLLNPTCVADKLQIKKELENALRAEPFLVAHGWSDYALREVDQLYYEIIPEIERKPKIFHWAPYLISP